MWEMIFLGIVQGLAEFLPISSSGHLVLFQRIFGMPETGLLLEILLHVGTLAAVLVVFFRDFLDMLLHPFRNNTLRMLIVATIPTVIVALLFEDVIDRIFQGWFLGISFLITSALLLGSELFSSRKRHEEGSLEHMRYQQALSMGCMQAFAILPGISRSGATIVGGLFSGLSRKSAAKFSFLMSAVATVGSLVFKFKDLVEMGGASFEGGWLGAILGMAAAAISGYLAIRWMLRLVERVSLKWFGLYTCIIGLLILLDQLFFGVVFDKII